jgi:hypothetical protein
MEMIMYINVQTHYMYIIWKDELKPITYRQIRSWANLLSYISCEI